jgi:RNA polymerase sigma-70 factor (ECF subfamily)
VAKKNTPAARPLSSDAQLFARFMEGDDGAFMELFDRHTHKLYMYCLKFVGDRGRAEDLVQDIWEKVIRMRGDGRDPIDNPVGFLVRMARNLCLNSIRDTRAIASLDDLPEGEHPSVGMSELTHHEEMVVAALARLPDPQREVLILNAYSGYRFDEIAAMLDEPVGAIRTRAWRGRVQLGRIISAMIEFDENRTHDNGDRRADSSKENEE